MSKNPLIVKCTSCGSIAEYNIKEQSYCCPACGGRTQTVDSITNLVNWRKKQQSEIKNQLSKLPHTITHCPNCGAEFFFKENEATGICPYCDTPMIRKEYDEIVFFPESIIPFTITLEEAKKKLLDFIDKPARSYAKEAEIAKANINKMRGYYLPYCLIRGPIDFYVIRTYTKRRFICEVYVEKNFVNASKELDNLVLDAMEPFDWKEIVPFNFGYISGQSVKIRNIDEKELIRRAVEEVTVQQRKLIAEELDSEAIEIRASSANILSASVLLPVYYFKVGDFTIAVNGQTGRVSMTNNKERIRLVNYSAWVYLAVTMSSLLALIVYSRIWAHDKAGILAEIAAFFMIYFMSPIGLTFVLMPKDIKILIEKNPFASDKCLAIRRPDMSLSYKYGENAIYEETAKPFFFEFVNSRIKNLTIKLDKYSSILKISLLGTIGPFAITLTIAVILSLYYGNAEIFTKLLKNKNFTSFVVCWVFCWGFVFFLINTIYNNHKYDFNFQEDNNGGLVLKSNFGKIMLGLVIVLSIIIGSMTTKLIRIKPANSQKQKNTIELKTTTKTKHKNIINKKNKTMTPKLSQPE